MIMTDVQALLHAEEMAQAQKPGRASGLPDDRFDLDSGRKTAKGQGGTGVGIKKQDTGPTVVTLTKDRIRDLFEAFPVLQDAYARHVPGVSTLRFTLWFSGLILQISEVEFWQRYFSSQLCEQHRASARKSANDEPKKDDIFDQYLEEPDWSEQLEAKCDAVGLTLARHCASPRSGRGRGVLSESCGHARRSRWWRGASVATWVWPG